MERISREKHLGGDTIVESEDRGEMGWVVMVVSINIQIVTELLSSPKKTVITDKNMV